MADRQKTPADIFADILEDNEPLALAWVTGGTGFRHLLFFVNSKNPVFKPFVAYFFVNFLNFICCTELYFYEKCAII